VSDIDIAMVDSLKALDLKWPIREADIARGPVRADIVAKVFLRGGTQILRPVDTAIE
jgi:hypothetical protein